MISIHALREEGDRHRWPHRDVCRDFYPRPPRGGRPGSLSEPHRPVLFLSTPSARRATPGAVQGRDLRPDISIHALREEGDGDRFLLRHIAGISIHALREEGDKRQWPRPTARTISIHALREEGDMAPIRGLGASIYFYPRPPRGGRRQQPYKISCPQGISIHALREEGDRAGIPPSMRVSEFLSTPSARRATRRWLGRGSGTDYFYPRPPRGGRLRHSSKLQQNKGYFYPRPPRGGRPGGA